MTPTEVIAVGVAFLCLEVVAFALLVEIFILSEVRGP